MEQKQKEERNARRLARSKDPTTAGSPDQADSAKGSRMEEQEGEREDESSHLLGGRYLEEIAQDFDLMEELTKVKVQNQQLVDALEMLKTQVAELQAAAKEMKTEKFEIDISRIEVEGKETKETDPPFSGEQEAKIKWEASTASATSRSFTLNNSSIPAGMTLSVIGVTAPILSVDTRPTVRTFLRDYELYLQNFAAQTGSVVGARTLASLMAPQLIQEWSGWNEEYAMMTEAERTDDERMQKFLRVRLDIPTNHTVEVDKIQVKAMDFSLMPEMVRFQNFMANVQRAFENADALHVLKHPRKDIRLNAFKRIIKGLGDTGPHETLKDLAFFHLREVHPEPRDLAEFGKLLKKACEEHIPLLRPYQKGTDTTLVTTPISKGRRFERRPRWQQASTDSTTEPKAPETAKPQTTSNINGNTPMQPARVKACAGCGKTDHLIRHCPTATKEQKEKFHQEVQASKAAAGNTTMGRISTLGKPRRFLKINIHKMEKKGLPDTGADVNAMDVATYGELMEGGEKKFDENAYGQVELVDTGVFVKVLAKARFWVKCNGVEREVEFVILDAKIGTIILGRPLLEAIGIDVYEMFEEKWKKSSQAEIDKSRSQERTNIDTDFLASEGPMIAAMFNENQEVKVEALVDVKHSKELVTEDERAYYTNFIGKELPAFLAQRKINEPILGVPEVVVKLIEGAKTVNIRQRSQTPAEREYTIEWCTELTEKGMLEPSTSAWNSPIYVVVDNSGKFRMTLDSRAVNQLVELKATQLEDLDQLPAKVKDWNYFFRLDLTKSFWQIELAEGSRDFFSFSTPLGNKRPRRLPMGYKNSPQELKEIVCRILGDLMIEGVGPYMDDILGGGKTIKDTIDLLRKVMERFTKHNVLINLEKSVMLTDEVDFCGRTISNKGVTFDKKKIAAVRDLDKPTTVAELDSFYHSVAWFRPVLPEFARIGAPILEYINMVCKAVGDRSARHLKKVEIEWTKELEDTFELLKVILSEAATLRYPSKNDQVFLWTDASSIGHGAIVTYTEEAQNSRPIWERTHFPAGFNSGIFSDTQRRWSVLEREMYAMVDAIRKFRFIVCRPGGITVLTDHKNLEYLLNRGPTADMKAFVQDKVQRWKCSMASATMKVIYIKGERNFFADMLSRFSNIKLIPEEMEDDAEFTSDRLAIRNLRTTDTPTEEKPANQPNQNKRVALIRLTDSTADPSFKVPTLEEFQEAQARSLEAQEMRLDPLDGLRKTKKGLIYIPDENNLRERLIMLAHSGRHKGIAATKWILTRNYSWKGIFGDVKKAVSSCIHCAVASSTHLITRELGHLARATRRNEILGMDFFNPVGKGKKGGGVILTMRCDYTGFTLLKLLSSETAVEVAGAVAEWCSLFGTPISIHTDKGAQFTGAILRKLTRVHRMVHKMSFADVHHTNGTIERTHSDLGKILRALQSEFQLTKPSWAELIPLVTSAINGTPTVRLQGHSPREAFLGQKTTSILDVIVNKETEEVIQSKNWPERLRTELKEFENSWSTMLDSIQFNPKPTPAEKSEEFMPGDLVMFALSPAQAPGKLDRKWMGPMILVERLSGHEYKLRDPYKNKTFSSHPARIKFFNRGGNAGDFEYQRMATSDEFVFHGLSDLSFNREASRFEVKVKWRGERLWTESTEDAEVVRDEYPEEFAKFTKTCKDNGTLRAFLKRPQEEEGECREEHTPEEEPARNKAEQTQGGQRRSDRLAQRRLPGRTEKV